MQISDSIECTEDYSGRLENNSKNLEDNFFKVNTIANLQ